MNNLGVQHGQVRLYFRWLELYKSIHDMVQRWQDNVEQVPIDIRETFGVIVKVEKKEALRPLLATFLGPSHS